MKKGSVVFIALLLVLTELNNTSAQTYQSTAMRLNIVKQAAASKGYMTFDQLHFGLSVLRKNWVWPYFWEGSNEDFEVWYSLFIDAINKDWLPFKAMFYLSLEKEDYDEAELVRRNWVACLEYLESYFDTLLSYVKSALGENKTDIHMLTLQKLGIQIKKLQIVGLTDSLLIMLRKELTNSVKNKQWDEAQKIQNIITMRVKELQPPPQAQQPQVVTMPAEERSYNVTVQQPPQPTQPSELNLKVEQIPRYGATDVGRAISLLQRKGANLTDKEAGTLKLIDILLER
jgi:hypothetical protein